MAEVLPTGWTIGWSAEHYHWYYFNAALSVTQWHKPPVTQTLEPEPEADPHLEADRALVRAMDSGDADAIEAAIEEHAPAASAGVLAHVRRVAQRQRAAERRRTDDPPKGRSLVSACYEKADVENEERQAPCDEASLALAMALQEHEYQQARLASRAATHRVTITGGASSAAARRAEANAEAMELRRHLYEGTPAEAAAPPPATSKGLSYATAARPSGETKTEPSRPDLARSAAAPTMQPSSVCVPRRPTRVAPSTAIRLLVDGGNVAFRYGEANWRPGSFEWRGLRLCVEYFAARGVALGAIAAAVNENRWDSGDADLAWLEARQLVSWTPTAKDDDLFVLSAAADLKAWVVTNDRWTDHGRHSRQVREAVRRRTIRFTWIREVFVPAADDRGRFGRAEGV